MERAERRLGMLLLLPAFGLLAGVVLYPIATLLWTSTQQMHLAQPWLEGFVGLENYARALEDPRFWSSLGTTALYVAITVPGAVLVGLGLALLANLPFRVKWPVRLGLLLPWALPLVFAGLIFR
jgi:multiple sugar transport system permease protein